MILAMRNPASEVDSMKHAVDMARAKRPTTKGLLEELERSAKYPKIAIMVRSTGGKKRLGKKTYGNLSEECRHRQPAGWISRFELEVCMHQYLENMRTGS